MDADVRRGRHRRPRVRDGDGLRESGEGQWKDETASCMGFLDISTRGDFLYLLRGSYLKFRVLPQTVTSCGAQTTDPFTIQTISTCETIAIVQGRYYSRRPVLIWCFITLIKASPIRACLPGEDYLRMPWELCLAAEMDDRSLSCVR
ncbi:hypothetical protein ARMSODRAFT_439403 [Armillaria solidipes]|uniref:Uncharacterized protein n=1 Tax=Armillaria solidipes TaxID=1076256 RepID=A0A2H3BGT7_9AGAR|nr:hypothetical protein ARMSODRAFT_439403 [Armillaria solidipes]